MNILIRNGNKALLATCMLVAAPLALPAAAADLPEWQSPPHKVVELKDLNLNTTQGVNELYRRIDRAAFAVCGDPQPRDLFRFPALRNCIDQALSRAIAEVNRPMLTNLHLAKTGKSAAQTFTVATR
jgi:UrcA family protein